MTGYDTACPRPIRSTVLDACAGVDHGFFSREGGVSGGLYGSLNCGLGSGDERSAVVENRRRVAETLSVRPDALLTCHQVHSADVLVVAQPWPMDERPKADAIVTRTPGIAVAALAADCAPILFADAAAGVIGAAHAGWKGALGGVAEATVAAMVALGADRARLSAVVGPCIGQKNYEVGHDFMARFLEVDEANGEFFSLEAGAKPRFALGAYVGSRLRAAGVGRVEVLDVCTYADPGRFFSYRRTTHLAEPDYGRQISAIALRG